jgi:hypothetical protein
LSRLPVKVAKAEHGLAYQGVDAGNRAATI